MSWQVLSALAKDSQRRGLLCSPALLCLSRGSSVLTSIEGLSPETKVVKKCTACLTKKKTAAKKSATGKTPTVSPTGSKKKRKISKKKTPSTIKPKKKNRSVLSKKKKKNQTNKRKRNTVPKRKSIIKRSVDRKVRKRNSNF